MSTRRTQYSQLRRPIAGSRNGSRYLSDVRRRRQSKVQSQRMLPRSLVGRARISGYYGGIEKKFVDTDFSDGTLASTMTFYNPMVIAQGDKENERVGRKVTLRSLHIRGWIYLLNATNVTNTGNLFRMRIVVDTQCNGAQFAATDLLESDTINSFSNLANRSRFRVLADKVMSFSAHGGTATGAAYTFGEVMKPINMNLRLNIPIEFDNSATTGAITTVRSNYLCIVMQSLTGEILSVGFTTRVRYTDY